MKGWKILSYNMLFHNSFDVKEPIHVDFYVNTSENSPKILFSLSVKRSTETKKVEMSTRVLKNYMELIFSLSH